MIKPREQISARWLRFRLRILLWVFAAVFVVLLGRAVDLQVLDQDKLSRLAQREIMKEVELAPRRGIIFDRNQEELAVSLDTDSVWARPLGITNPKEVGRKLAGVLGLEPAKVIERLDSEKGFVWVARRIRPDQAEEVKALGLKDVDLMREPKRFYPYTTLACHVLGFAGLDARGLEGLELSYDKDLRGQIHTVTSMRDALGRTVHLTPEAFTSLPEGHQLILTLDKAVQYQAEKSLSAAVAKYKAKAGQAVVMVPSTGEILAMASVPVYNPNVFGQFPSDTYRNRLITDAYEPGSTFKIFMAATAIRSERINLDQEFYCEQGSWRVGGRTIRDTHSYGNLNLAGIVKYSSNIGAAKVGTLLGADTLHETLSDFGFGKSTGIDLPGEVRGILHAPGRWRSVELANIAFGQGVAVTPMQLIRAVAAVANGGLMMKPYVVKAVVDKEARLIRENNPEPQKRVLTPHQAKVLTRMMEGVTEEGGTGTQAVLDGYRVAGKTGTAQKIDENGRYSHRDFMSSFVGFIPADDPKLAILVVVDTPRGSNYGGVVAAPVFREIARAGLRALGVRPPEKPEVLEAKAEGRDSMRFSPPIPPAASLEEAALALARGVSPDLGGLTLRQVLHLAGRRGVKLNISGWGRVVRQEPAPGAPLNEAGLSLGLAPVHGGAS